MSKEKPNLYNFGDWLKAHDQIIYKEIMNDLRFLRDTYKDWKDYDWHINKLLIKYEARLK